MARRTVRDMPPEEQPFPVRGYLIINLAFYLFCLGVYWMAAALNRGEVFGLIPILIAVALCFSLVSVYDALYDRRVIRSQQREQAKPARESARSSRSSSSSSSKERPTPTTSSGTRPPVPRSTEGGAS